jgi:tetratricopeptide (TPR) repeat protein
MLREIEQTGPACTVSIVGGIPLGYLFLQAGQHEQAIPYLQGAIAEVPHNTAVYGYLGDAYWLRGDSKTARQCYREGCSIDPAAIDWQHLKDDELIELRHELLIVHDSDPELASGWLPSHARVNGLFERKAVRIQEGLEEQVDEYLALRKSLEKKTDPVKLAKLFCRGIILCENEESLRLVKKLDVIEVRRTMKQANPELFADFLSILPASPAKFR